MEMVTLRFNAAHDLLKFRKKMQVQTIEINSNTLSLTCRCSIESVEVAQKVYGATVVKSTPV
jgi:hypothetical protein